MRKDGIFPSQVRRDSQSTMTVGMIAASNIPGKPALKLVEDHDSILLRIVIAAGCDIA